MSVQAFFNLEIQTKFLVFRTTFWHRTCPMVLFLPHTAWYCKGWLDTTRGAILAAPSTPREKRLVNLSPSGFNVGWFAYYVLVLNIFIYQHMPHSKIALFARVVKSSTMINYLELYQLILLVIQNKNIINFNTN